MKADDEMRIYKQAREYIARFSIDARLDNAEIAHDFACFAIRYFSVEENTNDDFLHCQKTFIRNLDDGIINS